MKAPAVTVLMPVYNAENFLAPAIESILGQTFTDFEFLIINDGSKDKTEKIIKDYAKKDKRINFINQTKNKGLVATLNTGLKKAKGIYIARQDADDISDSNRLAKQIKYMKVNPKTVIVGCSIKVMDNKGNIRHKHSVLLNDPELRQELLVRSPFAHGSVMFKRQAATKVEYDASFWPAEDYDLWLKMSAFGKLANLNEYLYTYREHDQGISEKNMQLQKQKVKLIQQKAWQEYRQLLSSGKVDLEAYRHLDMGELRIERIIDNSTFIAKHAWKHNQKSLALKILSSLGTKKIVYKKTAGKIKRRLKSNG